VYDRKRDGRYKARLVAGGHRQQPGIDFNETVAPVCSYRTVRMMLAVAAHEGLHLRQFDIKNAFLNGHLQEEVYIRPPKGWEHLAGGYRRVLRLNRALYGLRQAPRVWNERLGSELTALGFVQSKADPALWILRDERGLVLTMFYVDDGMVAARTSSEADALVDKVEGMFSIRKLGKPQDMLGIEISRNWDAGTIRQAQKARALAASFGVETESRALPMTPAVYGNLRAAQPSDTMADQVAYRAGIGSLLHMAQSVRPDVAAPVHALAAFSSKPTTTHYAAMLDIVRYVCGTADRGITYGRSKVPVEFWCDASFAACLDTRRSVTRWVAVCFGGAVSWECCKQPTVAASTMEAEYQACGSMAREALSFQKLLEEFALLARSLDVQGPLTVFCDNKAAIYLCKDRRETKRSKHIGVIHHFARDCVAQGKVQFVYCRSGDNVSDCLTKALPRTLFEKGLMGIGMLHQ
jgi:hypothetical protein